MVDFGRYFLKYFHFYFNRVSLANFENWGIFYLKLSFEFFNILGQSKAKKKAFE